MEVMPAGCELCADPVQVSLEPGTEVRRVDAMIAILRCPRCGCLVLDDILGWKGSGVVFRATEESIARYVRERYDTGSAPPDRE
jgi:hypothetical protein